MSHLSITFDYFCCRERCIQPFLNLANFRSSTKKSDKELLEQLIDNASKLLAANLPMHILPLF